jgi:hypothetical protein
MTGAARSLKDLAESAIADLHVLEINVLSLLDSAIEVARKAVVAQDIGIEIKCECGEVESLLDEVERCVADFNSLTERVGETFSRLPLEVRGLPHWLNEPRLPRGQVHGGRWTRISAAVSSADDDSGNWVDPRPNSIVTRRYREEIASRESGRGGPKHGYDMRGGRSGNVLGRYQMTEVAQKEIGLRNPDNSWNRDNGYGARGEEEFLANPGAQEHAFEDYTLANDRQLGANGAYTFVGQAVAGKEGNFTVTRCGLAAAAHREGARAVRDYLRYHRDTSGGHGGPWLSRRRRLDPMRMTGVELRREETRNAVFDRIETRLRQFERIPHRAGESCSGGGSGP